MGDFATAAVGVQVTLAAAGRARRSGSASPTWAPRRSRPAGPRRSSAGKRLDDAAIREAARLAAEESEPSEDLRGSVEYKRDLVRVLTARAIRRALERARRRTERRAGGGREPCSHDRKEVRMRVGVTINGERRDADVEPRLLLVHLIREVFRLTGTHIGCDTTHCGACTVLLDGRPVKSCTVFAVQADGRTVMTVEGLEQDGKLHPLQEGFVQEHGLQCGYCTPGMLMTSYEFLQRHPRPSEDEIRHAISGNLCRCTGYVNIVKAIQHAAARLAGQPAKEGHDGAEHAPRTSPEVGGMGHSIKRKEDPRFIRGQGTYVDDVQLPGMLYLDIVRSPYAHAKIVKIDTAKALAIPGVLAVITGQDLAKYNLHWMPTLMSDTQMVLPVEKVMYQAQEVAAVLATERYIAADGADAVEVQYEPLPVVVDPKKALEPGAPVLRTDKKDKNDNHIWHWEWGDRAATDRAFREAAVTVKEDIYLPRIHVASIETCGCVAQFDKVTGQADRLDDHAGPPRDPHGVRAGGGPRRARGAQDPDHLPRHRRRIRRQGAGLPRLRDRGRRVGPDREAGEVDRGPDGEPPGRLLRPRLPHHRRAGRRRRRGSSPRSASRPSPTTATPTRRRTPRSSRPGSSTSAPAPTTSRPPTSRSTGSTRTSRRAASPTGARSASPRPSTPSSGWRT